MSPKIVYRSEKKNSIISIFFNTPSGKIVFSLMILTFIGLPSLQAIKRLEDPSMKYGTNSVFERFLDFKPNPNEITSVGIWNADFAKIDSYGKSVQYSGNSVEELAKILSQYASTPEEKARIAYTWIANNINYDVQAYLSKDFTAHSPKETLTSRQVLCSGYAILYHALTSEMGLESIIIGGYTKGFGYSLGDIDEAKHAWNAVKLNGAWYLVDPTWGSGSLQENQFVRQFNPYFFGSPPDQFLYTHFPFKDEWQLLPQPKTKTEFETAPELSSEFFKNGFGLVSQSSRMIQIKGAGQLVLQAPADMDVIAVYEQIESDHTSGSSPIEQVAPVQRYSNQVVVALAPWARVYNLSIYTKKYQDPGDQYLKIAGYKVAVN